MPQEIKISDFSRGWEPSNDAFNGPKNCLLQMDNLELDQNGALTMIGGCAVKHSGFAADAHTLFSRMMNGTRRDYNCSVAGGIFRDTTSIGTGGDATIGAFGTAFNYVLACSGVTRKKDTGAAAVNLGILPATAAPVVVVVSTNAPYELIGIVTSDVVTPAAFGSSANVSVYRQLTANADGVGVLQTYDATPTALNANLLKGVGGATNIGYATENDFIRLAGYLIDPFGKSLQLDVLLVAGNSAGDIVSDYYKYVVDDLATEATFATDGSFSLKIRREDFERIGSSAADWSTVYGFRITFVGTNAEIINILGDSYNIPGISIKGGTRAQNGTVQYMQVNVNENGAYVGKSPIGLVSDPRDIDMLQATIDPIDPTTYDAQANAAWVFRRGGLLDKWYRVAVFNAGTGYAAAYDLLGDIDALALNITYNQNLTTVASSGLADKIYAILGPIGGRWYYFTANMMYPSDINNPDLIDTTLAVRTTGSGSEQFMWARIISEGTVLVGTSVDVYILNGTFITQPDFTVDIYYRALGCKFPPITYDADVFDNGIFYLASDGWRVIASNGENRLIVAPQTDLLYRNKSRQFYTAVNLKIVPGAVRFPVCVANNKLWCFITGTNRVEVFDFIRKYWRTFNYGLGDVTAAFATQDGQVIAFYGSSNIIREIDIQSSRLIDAATQQTIKLVTPVFDGGMIQNRKEPCTLKIRLNTGSSGTVTATVHTDTQLAGVAFSSISCTSDVLEQVRDMSATVAVCKWFVIAITGQVADFTLTDIIIDYEPRPLPVTFLRTSSTNFGTAARKRISDFPFQIDTLGNNVTATLYIDNVTQGAAVVNSAYRKTFDYLNLISGSDLTKGVDFEYTFLAASNGMFEFLGLVEPKTIEVFPEAIRGFVIPTTNYGTTGRKRLRVIRFVLDPLSTVVTFTPIIDGVNQTSQTYTASGKRTCFYYYTSDMIGVDFSGFFSAAGPFELWQVLPPQEGDVEPFPDTIKFMVLPVTNYGTTSRKRLRVIRMILDCKSATVTFTPIIDGVAYTARTYTGGKKTVYYYYDYDAIGNDFSGTLSGTSEFEVWAILPPEQDDIEKFPERVKFLVVPVTNFGNPCKKRIRVWPFMINTRGYALTFTPWVDGVAMPSAATVFQTLDKETVRHYFKTDVFGVYYSGIFTAGEEFELWESMAPDVVQVLPVARQFDQLGPLELFAYGKLKQLELRVMPFSSDPTVDLPFNIYFNDNTIFSDSITLVSNKEASYFVGLPKGTSGNIVRIELGPTSYDFHRFYIRVQAARSGRDTELEWITVSNANT